MTNKEAKEKAIEQMRNDGVVMSMQDIDRNNGWTRIEPDGSNLPFLFEKGKANRTLYKVCHLSEKYNTIYDFPRSARNVHFDFESKEITHFRPVEELKPPIW